LHPQPPFIDFPDRSKDIALGRSFGFNITCVTSLFILKHPEMLDISLRCNTLLLVLLIIVHNLNMSKM